jgi:hypothetical protein
MNGNKLSTLVLALTAKQRLLLTTSGDSSMGQVRRCGLGACMQTRLAAWMACLGIAMPINCLPRHPVVTCRGVVLGR